jgi:hypothetical protein
LHSVCTVQNIVRQTFIEIHFRTKSTTKRNVCTLVNFKRNSVKSDRIVSVPKIKPTDAENSGNNRAGYYVVNNFEFICGTAARFLTLYVYILLYLVGCAAAVTRSGTVRKQKIRKGTSNLRNSLVYLPVKLSLLLLLPSDCCVVTSCLHHRPLPERCCLWRGNEDSQCMYNVMLRRVRVTIDTMEKQ